MKIKILILLFLLFSIRTDAAEKIVPEEYVKAAFIFHFFDFVEWNDNKPTYYVCIPEDDSLRSAAQQVFAGKIVNKRRVIVTQRYNSCHVLVSKYIPSSQDVLTIGPLSKGNILEFRMVDHKLKFAVDPERVKESKIKISSQLLKLAILDKKI